MTPRVPVTDLLFLAAAVAGLAPSPDNNQPWRWLIDGDILDLRLDPSRAPGTADPENRLATLSCGAALHHARLELGADGWRTAVHRLPDPRDRDHLARLSLDGRTGVEPRTVRLARAIARRQTDRRPAPGPPPGAGKLRSIRAAVRREGADLELLPPGRTFTLAPAGDSPDRGWRLSGTTTAAAPPGRGAVFAILHGSGDDRLSWLTAGEALSAGWLTAVGLAVAVLPLIVTAEAGRCARVHRLPGGDRVPYLVLRFAAADPAGDEWPDTPRRPAESTVQVIRTPSR